MDFSKLRHRVIFLCPGDLSKNSMGETVPGYVPFKPSMPSSNDVYLTHDTDGKAVIKRRDGKAYSYLDALHDYSVAAFVSPMSGREYEESQKLRAETTYKIVTRFFPGITPQMRILYDSREFEIVSQSSRCVSIPNCRLWRRKRDVKQRRTRKLVTAMADDGTFGFEELQKAFNRIEQKYPNKTDAMLMAMARVAANRTKSKTPVGKTKKAQIHLANQKTEGVRQDKSRAYAVGITVCASCRRRA